MVAELSQEDVNRIAEAVVEKAAEDVGVRDIMIGSAMGKGAIPLYGRETRKEPCSCCLIDPEGPNTPDNRMCTTKGAIGTLKDSEERDWCSEINIVSDGRCARARSIREAARECKERHPDDTEAFFKCYIPAFSQAISPEHSNPSLISEDPRKEKYIRELIRTEITLGLLEADLTQMSKRAKELAEMTWDELLEYSPSKEGGNNPTRVRYDRADIDSAIEAAKRLKSDRDLYVFATYLGYTIDKRPPPGMQAYVIVHSDGTTETIKPGGELSPAAKEPWRMTLEQYALEKGARPAWVKAGYGETYRTHKRAVERAISEGKPVPPEVLADYPDLLKGAK